MSQESPLIVPLSSSRGWKRPERVSEATEPILWREEEPIITTETELERQATTTTTTTTTTINRKQPTRCAVCRQHESRYACPRCQTPYCSVDCYRNHSTSANITNTNTGTASPSSSEEEQPQSQEAGASPCTETFFQNRVNAIVRLETLEQKDKTHQLLNRQHHHDEATTTSFMMEDDDDDELQELLSALEDESMTEEQLLQHMSPTLKAAFQRDLQTGNGLQELILESWYPWWRRELVVSGKSGPSTTTTDDDDDNDPSEQQQQQQQQLPAVETTTLDERLLQLPHFSTFSRKGKQQPTTTPNLLYNLVDILYSISWTLRLYHGARNATRHLPVEAAATLVSSSSVLNHDTRYSTMEEVLSECVTRSCSSQKGLGNNNSHWTVLTEDCALLMTSHRLVGKALLEASDLCKAAIHQMKKKKTQPKIDDSDEILVEKETHTHLTRLRRVRKKLEFFLTWAQQATVTSEQLLGEETKEGVLAWMEDWKLYGDDVTQQEVHTLQLPDDTKVVRRSSKQPSEATNASSSSPQPPMLVPLETRRKIVEID